MDTKELRQSLDDTLSAFMQRLRNIDASHFDQSPFEGSWSAGQVAEHIILSDSGFLEMINGPVEECGRQPDQFIPGIRESFLDFSVKMDSPDFVRPRHAVHNKEEQLASLDKIRSGLLEACLMPDLNALCVSFEIPMLGHLTRLEALHFVLYHTQRHLHQLEGIAHSFSGSFSE